MFTISFGEALCVFLLIVVILIEKGAF